MAQSPFRSMGRCQFKSGAVHMVANRTRLWSDQAAQETQQCGFPRATGTAYQKSLTGGQMQRVQRQHEVRPWVSKAEMLDGEGKLAGPVGVNLRGIDRNRFHRMPRSLAWPDLSRLMWKPDSQWVTNQRHIKRRIRWRLESPVAASLPAIWASQGAQETRGSTSTCPPGR